jgi:hypothetical protein
MFRCVTRTGISKLHVESRGRLEIVDRIILDNRHTDFKRYREILAQAPSHTEIERQEQPVPVVNFIRLASAAESDDPLRDVGLLQNDFMGCRRSISAVGSIGS